ncbi:hypothetical protein [Desulfosediminicola ganghwensis]|uniref:hypothetical protein n=1 Tax=Desulfosediminicola ganghwensis TaxID=2569540 RepID=UPI0010ACA934|nr:hypothetical protein [Desulfosediminicola ganghwensis]
MEDQIKERIEVLRRKRRNRSLFPAALVSGIFIVVVSAFFFYQNKTDVQSPDSSQLTATTQAEPAVSVSPKVVSEQTSGAPNKLDAEGDPIGDIISSSQIEIPEIIPQAQPAVEQTTPKVVAEPVIEPDVYQQAADRIRHFYSEMDEKRYIKGYHLNEPSESYFSSLTQKALDNPPIVSGETDDLFNVLKNTAHFFRVVGKKNIIVIKSILHEEKKSYEDVLADYYLLSKKPEYLNKEFSLQVTDDALLEYAGFFLNTMGGRLYLFRRDSVSRMLVNYYAILIVDQANHEARNSYGIDIKPAITALIDELETSNAQLQSKETYLDTLYTLKERY